MIDNRAASSSESENGVRVCYHRPAAPRYQLAVYVVNVLPVFSRGRQRARWCGGGGGRFTLIVGGEVIRRVVLKNRRLDVWNGTKTTCGIDYYNNNNKKFSVFRGENVLLITTVIDLFQPSSPGGRVGGRSYKNVNTVGSVSCCGTWTVDFRSREFSRTRRRFRHALFTPFFFSFSHLPHTSEAYFFFIFIPFVSSIIIIIIASVCRCHFNRVFVFWNTQSEYNKKIISGRTKRLELFFPPYTFVFVRKKKKKPRRAVCVATIKRTTRRSSMTLR